MNIMVLMRRIATLKFEPMDVATMQGFFGASDDALYAEDDANAYVIDGDILAIINQDGLEVQYNLNQLS